MYLQEGNLRYCLDEILYLKCHIEPEDFLQFFDTDDIEELRESIEDEDDDADWDDDEDDEEENDNGNYDNRKDEITDYGNPEYKEIIDNAGCYTDEVLLYKIEYRKDLK